MSSTRILVAPLNWGLGHATRCIPIIKLLIKHGVEPVLASDGAALALLRVEFPELKCVDMDASPDISYASGNPGSFRFFAHLTKQYPKFKKMVLKEQEMTKSIMQTLHIDGIISDQRFGVYSHQVPSVLISHQLNPPVPGIRNMVRKINFGYYRNFKEVWVPDFEGAASLSGELSFHGGCPVPVNFVGYLSRFESCQVDSQNNKLVVSLSGPEPQRTEFEQKVVSFLQKTDFHYSNEVLIVRGILGDSSQLVLPGIRIENHLTSNLFYKELCSARWIISRSGYSSLMDYAVMGKKAIIVPTPGQAEQEYLAKFLENRPLFVSGNQKNINIQDLLKLLDNKDVSKEQAYAEARALNDAVQSFLFLAS